MNDKKNEEIKITLIEKKNTSNWHKILYMTNGIQMNEMKKKF